MCADRYRIANDIAAREVAGQVLVFVPDQGKFLWLNESATVIWPALDDGTTAGELVELLRDHYGMLPDSVLDDVSEWLRDMEARRVLNRCVGATGGGSE